MAGWVTLRSTADCSGRSLTNSTGRPSGVTSLTGPEREALVASAVNVVCRWLIHVALGSDLSSARARGQA